jgi:hypothetical protein
VAVVFIASLVFACPVKSPAGRLSKAAFNRVKVKTL